MTFSSKVDESKIFDDKIIHLVQSRYAYEFLVNKGLKNIQYLSDYLSPKFLEEIKPYKKEEYVCYTSPKKGKDITDKILSKAKGKVCATVRFTQEKNQKS